MLVQFHWITMIIIQMPISLLACLKSKIFKQKRWRNRTFPSRKSGSLQSPPFCLMFLLKHESIQSFRSFFTNLSKKIISYYTVFVNSFFTHSVNTIQILKIHNYFKWNANLVFVFCQWLYKKGKKKSAHNVYGFFFPPAPTDSGSICYIQVPIWGKWKDGGKTMMLTPIENRRKEGWKWKDRNSNQKN